MVSFPNAKINLGLNITQKRADGFHDIETIFYPIPWYDILEIIPSNNVSFTSSGLPIPGTSSDNLCVKAYHLLANAYKLPPVHIHLRKEIPMGAGLGGGSADAAFTLRLLNDLFELSLSKDEMASFAGQLGSDCPFFIYNTPHMATGVGDILSPHPIDLKGYHLTLVYPGTHISTAEAYGGVSPQQSTFNLSELYHHHPSVWHNHLKNDFEEHLFKRYPTLNDISNQLTDAGAIYTAMSGSGSTIFGIFETPPLLNFPDRFTVKGLSL